MKTTTLLRTGGAAALLSSLPGLALAADAISGAVQKQATNYPAIIMFLLFVALTLVITFWAARRTKSAADFYTAGGGITGFQNGLAIAGDYMSAATFLGLSGMVFAKGFDGLIYTVGFLVGWPMLMFLIAERLRNLGRFTFADVVSYRLQRTPIRTLAASGSLVTVCLYLIAQMVGAGKLIQLLFGLDYAYAVVLVGVLMTIYVMVGGMLATTWVQITKAVLLLCGGTVLIVLALARFDFSLNVMMAKAVEIHTLHDKLLRPGTLVPDVFTALSLSLALICGPSGLPHILMRFFTVADAKEARKSVFFATGFIGYFFMAMVLVGFCAIVLVQGDPAFLDAKGKVIGGGNMAAVHLSRAIGGDLFMGFISAVAFATILAVVAGLTLAGASAVSHDLYAQVICKGKVSEDSEIRVSRISVLVLSAIAIGLGLSFENQNIAFMVSLAFAVASSVNFPVIVTSIFWKGLTTRGALAGGFVGLISALTLVILSPSVWVAVIGNKVPVFPYDHCALISMPLAFFTIWFFSITDKSKQADSERAAYLAQYVRAETGIGAAAASAH